MVPYRSTGKNRIRGKLNKNKDRLAVDRVVRLPVDLATVYAAAQNFRIDLAKGIYPSTAMWKVMKEEYLEEALELMKEQGSNLFPGDNDEPWIQLQAVGHITFPSVRAQSLVKIFDVLFSRDNTNLLKGVWFPTPESLNTDMAIAAHYHKIVGKFVYH